MKTLVITGTYNAVLFDPDTLDLKSVDGDRTALSRIYKIDEDCQVKYDDEIVNVKAGQIVVTFYEDIFPHKVIIVDNSDWIENLNVYKETMENAKLTCDKCCNDECPSCCKSLN